MLEKISERKRAFYFMRILSFADFHLSKRAEIIKIIKILEKTQRNA